MQSAEFRQQYRQAGGPALPVAWWECRDCRGWFAYPVPTVDAIRKNWGAVAYANPVCQPGIFEGKQHVISRILTGLAKRISPGDLLDVGCSTGMFMLAAQKAGWRASGIDPNESAANAARQQGFDVRPGWSLDQSWNAASRFHAVTLIAVF